MLLVIVAAVILLAGFGGYAAYKRRQTAKLAQEPTVEIDGKAFKTSALSAMRNKSPLTEPANITPEEQITKLEKELTTRKATYSDYHNLAQLYLQAKNTPKAIENYELALNAADPKMPYYDSFAAATRETIKKLKEQQ